MPLSGTPGKFRIEARWQPGPRRAAYDELWRRIYRDISAPQEPPR